MPDEKKKFLGLEDPFRHLVEGVHDYAIFMLDPAGRVTSWNAGAERIKGYAAHEIIGQHFSHFYPQEAIARGWPQRELQAAAASGRFEDEGWRLRKDGTRFWANVVITPIRDAQGALRGYSKVTRDLTERRQLEESLRKSEERLRLVLEKSQDAFISIDERGTIIEWNPAAERMFGWRRETALGHSLGETIIPLRQRDEHERGLKRFFETGEGPLLNRTVEVSALCADGSELPVELSISPARTDTGTVFNAFLRDISERKRAEQVLRESEERMRSLVESVRDYAIFMLDPEGRVMSWNAGAERIKGYKAQEVIGNHFSLFYTTEARQKKWPEQELAMAREHGRFEEEALRVRKGGGSFWANVVLTPIYDQAGLLRGYAQVTRDLTDVKRIEALENAERQTNEFLATLAHELRNPLAPIRNALHLLARKPVSDPGEQWVREVLERQTGQMTRLVDDLLDVSRITRSAIKLERRLLDLRSVVRSAVDASLQWTEARRHELSVELPAERVDVQADEARLVQVVQNLLHNAAKYTPEGGRIVVAVRREGEQAIASVADNGIGMTEEMLKTAFELFRQGPQALDRPQGGLGIGLTLVQRLVMLHGGSVEARSAGPDRGSEFIVRLPLPTAVQPASAARSAPRRVLVIDDNHDAAQALQRLLQEDGHDVRTAGDGETGFAAAQEMQPDVVLLDIGLPRLDGYAIAARIRAEPRLARTKVVAITGYGQVHDRARASAAGFDHYLVKPVDYRAVQELLGASA